MIEQEEFSFKNYFVPFTNAKAIIWIVIIGLTVFANMLLNGFVWDDLGYIINYSPVHSLNFLFAFTKNMFNTGSQFRPIPIIYLSFFYSIFGQTPFFYHLLQLILHISNTILLFFLFKHFFKNSLAFFLSLIFLIHPLQVESVSYIASIDNPLFFLFGLLALFLGLEKRLSVKRLLLIYTLIIVSMLTKETGFVFILLILIYRFLYTRSKFLLNLVLGITTVLLYIVIRNFSVGIYYKQSVLSPIAGLSFTGRLLNVPLVFFYYLSNFFYPARLATDQLWIVKNIQFNTFYAPLLIECIFFFAIAMLGFYLYKKHNGFSDYLFFLLWFLIGMGAYVQIVPLDFTVNDRWFYFPIVGLVGLLGMGIKQIKASHAIYKTGLVLGVFFVLSLSLRTIVRNTNWSDNLTLFTHDNHIVENYDIENNIGGEYFSRNDYHRALTHYLKSEELLPYELNTYNVGVTYEQLENIPFALKYYGAVIKRKNYLIDPVYKQYAYEAIAKIYAFRQKPTVTSLNFIKAGLSQYPTSGYLWASLADEYYKLGKKNEAITAALHAKAILPSAQTNYMYQQILNNKPIIFQ